MDPSDDDHVIQRGDQANRSAGRHILIVCSLRGEPVRSGLT